MPGTDIGSEQFTDEDRGYAGSRFRDVVDALFANPYQQVWGRAGEPPLPVQEVTIRSVFGGAGLIRQASPFRSRVRAVARLRRRPSLGAGSERLHAVPASKRRLPRRALADHRRHAVFGLFRPRPHRARRRPVLERRRRTATRSDPIDGDGRQALSDDGSGPPHAAAHGQLHHAGGYRRGDDRVDQRRRAPERAGRHRLPARSRRARS